MEEKRTTPYFAAKAFSKFLEDRIRVINFFMMASYVAAFFISAK
jgi:hypothetical protein